MVTRMLTPAQAAVEALHVPGYVVAAKVRIGPSDFGRIIRGRQIPTPDQAQRIAAAVGVPAGRLFGPLNELEPPECNGGSSPKGVGDAAPADPVTS